MRLHSLGALHFIINFAGTRHFFIKKLLPSHLDNIRDCYVTSFVHFEELCIKFPRFLLLDFVLSLLIFTTIASHAYADLYWDLDCNHISVVSDTISC